jgi:uncharacterized protein (TIGR02284 family)
MSTRENLLRELNDLVKINYDRIAGYEKAISECKEDDVDLKGLFRNMANGSEQYVLQLSNLISRLGGQPSDDTTTPGKMYRTWMDLKAVLTGSNRKALLSSCEYGEDAAQKAYNAALFSDSLVDDESRQLVPNNKHH